MEYFYGVYSNFLSKLGTENGAHCPVSFVLHYEKELIALDVKFSLQNNVPTAASTAKQNICPFTAQTLAVGIGWVVADP